MCSKRTCMVMTVRTQSDLQCRHEVLWCNTEGSCRVISFEDVNQSNIIDDDVLLQDDHWLFLLVEGVNGRLANVVQCVSSTHHWAVFAHKVGPLHLCVLQHTEKLVLYFNVLAHKRHRT